MKRDAYICDRCGAVIRISPEYKEAEPHPWKMRLKNETHTVWFQRYTKHDTFDFWKDLCNDCHNELMRWWDNGKVT